MKRIYGYLGDGINGLMGAFHDVGDEVEFIQTRHEEIAAFAATAHAKLTGEVGVCMATSGARVAGKYADTRSHVDGDGDG